MNLAGSTETVLFFFLCTLRNTSLSRVWKTLYMDEETDCNKYERNNDMSMGDMYIVSSDPFNGGSEWTRRAPAECSRNFNLGDRLIGVEITQFWCTKGVRDPFLAIYSNCDGRRSNLLGWYNCTSEDKRGFNVPSTCLLIYHYRGRTTSGYYFSMNIIAKEEVMGFPAGGSAAIFFVSVVLILVVVKIFCVITGYETRIPNLRINIEEQKQILIQEESADERSRKSQYECTHEHPPSPLVSTFNRNTDPAAAGPSGVQINNQHSHKIITISHSGGASSASESASIEFDQTEFPSPPKKKHYVSSRMSRTFRL